MRSTQYQKLGKNIAASDTGGVIERWRYGCCLRADSGRSTPAGHLKHGVLAELLGIAAECGDKLSEREIQRRLQAARTYPTEAEIRLAADGFRLWSDLYNAGFPPVEVPEPGDPHDPRSDADRRRDNERTRRKAKWKDQPALPGLGNLELPNIFSHETHSPQTPVRSLLGEAEIEVQLAKNFGKLADEKFAYAAQLAGAADGNLDMSWYEAEARRLGLKTLGLSSWGEFHEITRDFLGSRGTDPGLCDPDADEE